MNKIWAVVFTLALFTAGGSFAGSTSIFYKGGVLSLDNPPVEVRRIYGLTLLPVNVTIKSSDKEVYFSHNIENHSNDTIKVNIELLFIKPEKGWGAELILDENADGIRQPAENVELGPSLELGEGSTFHFFLKLKMPDNAVAGDAGSAVVKASCSIKDGTSYIGDNGVIYGGDDIVESEDTLIVE